MALLVLLLLIISLSFSFSGGAPVFFGSSIYVVKTDAFEIIEQGSAVIASKVPYADIVPGNIVVYSKENGDAALAEIHTSNYVDNVYSFTAADETGEDLLLTQSNILSKAMKSSRFLGGLISFAKSPAGVMLIAVIPCFTVLGYEVFRFIMYRIKGISPVTPIKKQDEVPTFVPRPKVDKAVSAYKSINDNPDSEKKAEPEKKYTPPKTPQELQRRNISTGDDFPLYRTPQRKPPPVEKPPEKRMPLSQKRLNEVIAQTKAKQQSSQNINTSQNTMELNNSTRTTLNNTTSLNENLKQYTPRKQTSARVSATQGIPRLDELLRDDNEHDNTGYNIESILNSFDRNKSE